MVRARVNPEKIIGRSWVNRSGAYLIIDVSQTNIDEYTIMMLSREGLKHMPVTGHWIESFFTKWEMTF